MEDLSYRCCRIPTLVLIGAVLSAAWLAAQAQPCAAPRHDEAPASPAKFALIEALCPALALPAAPRRAAQLDAYSVTIALDEPALAAPPAPRPALPAAATAAPAPLGRQGLRVVEIAPALTAAARAHGVDPLLLHAVAHVESRHNPAAVSPAGARGLMQMMPATAQRFGVGDAGRLFDARTNADAAAALLRTLRRRYGDDLRLVLAAYNAGEGAVDKYNGVPPYPETEAYVRDVLAVHRRLSERFAVAPDGTLLERTL